MLDLLVSSSRPLAWPNHHIDGRDQAWVPQVFLVQGPEVSAAKGVGAAEQNPQGVGRLLHSGGRRLTVVPRR
jgi:hypothetical protein